MGQNRRKALALQSVRRACYAGLDSVTFRREVMDRISRFIPSDAYTFATTDPDTGLLTHAVAQGVPDAVFRSWIEYLYPHQVAQEVIDLARRGEPVSTQPSDVALSLLRPEGLGHDLRGVACDAGVPWGFLCFLRDNAGGGFTEDEAALLRALVPDVTEGLRIAAMRERAERVGVHAHDGDHARAEDHTYDGDHGGARDPGVVILDERGRVETRTPAATWHLRDLGDVGASAEVLPFGVASAVAALRHTSSDRAAGGDGHAPPAVHAPGRSGRWYRIQALGAEPDAEGRSRRVVLIEPARGSELGLIFTRLYGLTPREREVISLAARGWSTRSIARFLSISSYTVQEHVGNACARVGVRSRKELLAKLFFDGYARGVALPGTGMA